MAKPRVYLETSVISYLTARLSRDLVTVGRQELTREWWDGQRQHFELFVSEFVLEEVSSGDPDASRSRLDLLAGVPEVSLTPETRELAASLVEPGPIPRKAVLDAFHIAAAVAGGADYLLTWNFKHLANAALRKRIEAVCVANGYEAPVICTPEELMET
jgi:predicted nucleic acid-binding protein